MSSFPTHASPFDDFDGPKGSNILGITGFVLSLLCVTAPIGLLVSLIALYKAPRGFAIAGVIIGMIFSAVLGAALWGTLQLSKFATGASFMTGIAVDHEVISQQCERFNSETSTWPTALAEVNLPPGALIDPWGTPYTYSITNDTWKITTAGPDATIGTADDFTIGRGETFDNNNTAGQQMIKHWSAVKPSFREAIESWKKFGEEIQAIEQWQQANQGMSSVAGRGMLPPETPPVDASPADGSAAPAEAGETPAESETP